MIKLLLKNLSLWVIFETGSVYINTCVAGSDYITTFVTGSTDIGILPLFGSDYLD